MRVSYLAVTALMLMCHTSITFAATAEETAKALRLANIITGGFMPATDPIFTDMVNKVAAGDFEGAALAAANSKYFANYLARRLAFQMQNPNYDASTVTDSDATAFLIAKLVGAGTDRPSLSTIWSDNATYLVNLNGTPTRAAALTPAQLPNVDWSTQLLRQNGQTVRNPAGAAITLPVKHVGGYATLNDRINDNSLAQLGATAGTNLRYIESIWEIATGMEIMDFSSAQALTQDVPRFIPQNDPNFFKGAGQPACISCHGGGIASINHGYSTVADIFNFDPARGLTYIDNPNTATRKSLGSDAAKRQETLACNLVATPAAVCNPDSAGVDPNQGWNVSATWQTTGVLNAMGWTGATSGQGLNELGISLGKAKIIYENFVKRVVDEVCPTGSFKLSEVKRIAAAANPFATPAGTDDIRTIVGKVASHVSCM